MTVRLDKQPRRRRTPGARRVVIVAAAATVAAITSLAGPLFLAAPAFAHHSPAVFDQTREIELTGVVTEFKWANPHSWIHIDVTNDDGGVDNWAIEMNPPTYLVRGGWRSNTIGPGDVVTVTANPLRTNEKAAKFLAIKLPDGRVLGEQEAVLGEE